MKVNIGPYIGDLIPIGRLETKFNIYRGTCGQEPTKTLDILAEKLFDYLNSVVRPINNWYYNHKNRTVEVEYSDYDTWNLDHTLALVILPGLKQLKSVNHGFSHVDAEDAPEELEDEARWLYVQDEMIWAFEQLVLEDKPDFCVGVTDYQFEELDNGNSRLIKGPNHTLVLDIEAEKAYNDRINNGLKLFGKYFRALWD